MKSLLAAAALLAVTASSAFAITCRVDMVRTNGSFMRTITAYDCMEAMKECRKAIRLEGNYGRADCVQQNTYPSPNPAPYPAPYPTPAPTPYPTPAPMPNQASYFLRMSDAQLSIEVQRGIGDCMIQRGPYGSAKDWYLKLNGVGIAPSAAFTKYGGTNFLQDGLMAVREMLSAGLCTNEYVSLRNMSPLALTAAAMGNKAGACQVALGNNGSAHTYYIKVDGVGVNFDYRLTQYGGTSNIITVTQILREFADQNICRF